MNNSAMSLGFSNSVCDLSDDLKVSFDYFYHIPQKRRNFIKLGAASIVSIGAIMELLAQENLPKITLDFIKDKNIDNLKLNTFEQITSHNNFYEFTTSQSGVKDIAHTLNTDNWSVTIDGLVENPMKVNLDDLVKMFTIEERIYRFRCVEGWSMVVPWNGFSLASLIKKVKPLSSAKYVRFETLVDPEVFPDQKRGLLWGKRWRGVPKSECTDRNSYAAFRDRGYHCTQPRCDRSCG